MVRRHRLPLSSLLRAFIGNSSRRSESAAESRDASPRFSQRYAQEHDGDMHQRLAQLRAWSNAQAEVFCQEKERIAERVGQGVLVGAVSHAVVARRGRETQAYLARVEADVYNQIAATLATAAIVEHQAKHPERY